MSVTAPQVCHLSTETQHGTIRTEYPNRQRLRKEGGDQAKENSRDGEQSWSHPPGDCDNMKGQYPRVRAVKGVLPRYPWDITTVVTESPASLAHRELP